MSDPRRFIEIFLDTEQGIRVGEDGKAPRKGEPFTIFRNTQTVVRAHLRKTDLTYFKPPTGAEFFYAVDTSFDPVIEDVIVTQDADFNDSDDWADKDPDNGKVCWRANSATTRLETRMGSEAFLDSWSELWMIVSGIANPILLAQWSTKLKNIVSEIDADTVLETVSSNVIKFVGDKTRIYKPDGTVWMES